MILQGLRASPELGVFLAVGLGYWLGTLKLGNFSLGAVTSALLCGLVIGNYWKEPSGDLRAGFFLLFLFANGYSVGPQFISSLMNSGSKPLLLSLVVCLSGLVSAVAMARILGLDAGLGAGLFSGGMTASAAMGTATDAIKSLPLPPETAARLISHVVVADALCYVFGAIGVIWFLGSIAPRLLRIDLREEAKALERELGIEDHQAGVFSARQRFTARSFHIHAHSCVAGRPVAAIERLEPGESRIVEGEFRLPFPQIVPIRQGKAAMLLPLARFRLEVEGAAPVVRTFVVGQPGAAAGLQPFRLDLGPRVYPKLAQHAFA